MLNGLSIVYVRLRRRVEFLERCHRERCFQTIDRKSGSLERRESVYQYYQPHQIESLVSRYDRKIPTDCQDIDLRKAEVSTPRTCRHSALKQQGVGHRRRYEVCALIFCKGISHKGTWLGPLVAARNSKDCCCKSRKEREGDQKQIHGKRPTCVSALRSNRLSTVCRTFNASSKRHLFVTATSSIKAGFSFGWLGSF